MSKDFYQVLGVEKNAPTADIKKAFRKKAVKLHPDTNPDDPKAEEAFKDLNEAYAVLSDPEKRKQYDMFGNEGFRQRYSTEDIFQGTDFSSIFSDLGFGSTIFGNVFGGASAPGGQTHPFGGFGADFGRTQKHKSRRSAPKGKDLIIREEIGFFKAVMGGEHRVQINHGGDQRTITVRIPAGIDDGQKIRVKGAGEQPNGMGRAAGNLLIQVKVSPHPTFRRDGDRLLTTILIPVSTLLLGGTIDVPMLDPPDETKKIRIKPGTPADTQLRIRGAGGPKKNGKRKDLYVIVQPDWPTELTEEQQALVEQLRELGL